MKRFINTPRAGLGPIRVDWSSPYARDLVGFWPVADQLSWGGPRLRDAAGTHTGTSTSFPSYNVYAARGGNYYSGKYVDCGATNGIIGDNCPALTLVASWNTTSTTSAYLFATKRYSSESTLCSLSINQDDAGSQDGGRVGVVYNNTSSTHTRITADVGGDDGAWHCVAASVGAAGCAVSVDGIEAVTSSTGFGPKSGNTASTVIGAFHASQLNFTGWISGVFLYTRVLSSAELCAITRDQITTRRFAIQRATQLPRAAEAASATAQSAPIFLATTQAGL